MTSDTDPSSKVSRRSRLVRGGVVMTLVSVANRISSFIAQLFLGQLLFPEEFGLFAIAVGLTNIGAAVRSALQPVLIGHLEHDHAAFDRTYRTTMTGLWLLAAVGVAGSGLIESTLRAPGLQPLLIILLVTMPFQVLGGFGMARISHSLEFNSVGKAQTAVPLARHISTVGFAFAGLGPLSFALGGVVSVAAELATLSRYTSLVVRPGLFSAQTIADIRSSVSRFTSGIDRRWIWGSAIALNLAASGRYPVAAIWTTKQVIGLYYFAGGLTAAFWLPLYLAVNTVLVPGFVTLRTKAERRDRTMETVETFAVLGVLLFNGLSVMIVPLTHLMWAGKWDSAIPALLALSLFAPLQFIHPVVHAIQRGTGAWNLYMLDISAYAVLTIIAASIGAYIGGLASLALTVVLAEVIVTFGGLVAVSRLFDIRIPDIIRVSVGPWLLGLVGLGAAHLIHPLNDPDIGASLLRLPVFGVLTLLLVAVPYRRLLIGLAQSMLSRS
ncbi:MAG: oligosaccharide flippase family protein [Actinomycetia bacterium]|nr:oligosaccharide flippase family protein [Actinomycetes bacterium]